MDLQDTDNSLPFPSFHRRREGESPGTNKARKQEKKARVVITRSRLFRRCAGSCERQFKACPGGGKEGKKEKERRRDKIIWMGGKKGKGKERVRG